MSASGSSSPPRPPYLAPFVPDPVAPYSQVTYLLSYQDISAVMADTAEEELAAVKIQAAMRGRQARREVGELKEQTAAAVKIQAVHRGAQGRKKAASVKQEMR